MSEKPPLLDPAILAVLETARPLTDAPSSVRSRILSSVEMRIAALPSGGGTDGDGGDGGGAGAGGGEAGGAGAGAGAGATGGWLAAHPLLALGAVFAIGGVAGAVLREATLPPPRVIYVDRVVAAAPAFAPASPVPEATAAAVRVESLPTAPALSAPVAPAPADSGEHLRAESALLDAARAAVARGDAERALAAVDRHEATFANGLLREEREALAIKALILAGRGDQAATRGARFRERYPTSVLLPAVDSALRSVPR
jgi:hypothetical protein